MNDTYTLNAESQSPPTVDEQPRPLAPLETRTVAMIAVALIVLPFVLYAGAAFFIPLFVSLFMSYALSPVVDWMERCRVPRAWAPRLTMLLVIAASSALGVQQALNGTTEVLEELPQAVQKLRVTRSRPGSATGKGALKQVQKTADELQKLAGASTTPRIRRRRRRQRAAPAPEPKTMVAGGHRRHGDLRRPARLGPVPHLLPARRRRSVPPPAHAGDGAVARGAQEGAADPAPGPRLEPAVFRAGAGDEHHGRARHRDRAVLSRRPPSGILGHRDGDPAHDSVPRRGAP